MPHRCPGSPSGYSVSTGKQLPGRGAVYTDGNGFYTMRSVPAGIYKVRFGPDGQGTTYPPGTLTIVWNGGAATYPAAPILTVDPGTQQVVDATVVRAGALIGTVTAPGGHAADPPVTVRAYRLGGSTVVAKAVTATRDGSYLLGGLPAGTYQVRAGVDTYAPAQWYPGVANRGSAGSVAVVVGSETTADIGMGPGWEVETTPAPAQGDDVLRGVDCLSATWCMAEGSTTTGPAPAPPWPSAGTAARGPR